MGRLEWEFTDHGCMLPCYYQGACRWSYDEACSGVGYSLTEALQDALDFATEATGCDEFADALEAELEALIGAIRRDGDDVTVADCLARMGICEPDEDEESPMIHVTLRWTWEKDAP